MEKNQLITIEDKIIDLLKKSNKGLDFPGILSSQNLEGEDQKEVVAGINKLCGKNQILNLHSIEGTSSVFKYILPEIKELKFDEQILYFIIERAGSKGINNQKVLEQYKQNKVNKQDIPTTKSLSYLLKSLEKQDLIKSVECAYSKKKQKVWMLKDVEPDPEIRPSDMFDTDKNESIQEVALAHLKSQNLREVSMKELVKIVKQSGNLDEQDQFKEDEIAEVISVLEYDQKIERVSGEKLEAKLAYSQTPCSHCPVQKECGPNNLINPRDCPHLKNW